MIIYQTQKSGFLHDVHHRDIEEVIHEAFRAKTGHRVSKEEVRSWASSLTYMGKVLMDDAIPGDCGVAIEYTIPHDIVMPENGFQALRSPKCRGGLIRTSQHWPVSFRWPKGRS